MTIPITDDKLRKSTDTFFEKLEKYFPEHKVFAIGSIDDTLQDKMNALYKKIGYGSAEEFLNAYGFRTISGDEIRLLRSTPLCAPGNEPEIIKKKVENALALLNGYYPDKVIPRGLQNDHHSLSQTISGLYRWLGYASASDMLSAYGFNCRIGVQGRPSNDHQALIEMLQEKYRDRKIKSLSEITAENPELAGRIKTLSNASHKLFGMTLSDYFIQVGILKKEEIVEKVKTYHYFMVSPSGSEELIPCSTNTRTIREGDNVEVTSAGSDDKQRCVVRKTCYYTPENELPCPMDKMAQFVRKVSVREIKNEEKARQQALQEIEDSKLKYLYCSVRFEGRDGTLYYISPFEDIAVGDIVKVNHLWYGDTTAFVEKVELCSTNTAPYPPRKTKSILEILKSAKRDQAQSALQLEALIQSGRTEPFERKTVEERITEKYNTATYFSSTVFRGLGSDVKTALTELYPLDLSPAKHAEEIADGVFQFQCESATVPVIIEKYPNLKAISFAEDWRTGSVYLAFSESGYPTVTSMRYIGECDFYEKDRWPLIHDPSKDFSVADIVYKFDEKPQWENFSFVLPDDRQLICDIPLPSKPYKKETMSSAYEIIKIIYLE